ncbi:MAG: cupin domain-containing protein [Ramlibacter sp.]
MVTAVTNRGPPMPMQTLYQPPATPARRVHVFDMAASPWQATANPGLWLKPVRQDDVLGHYLGLVRFDAGTRSGLHQHQGVATSFVVDGGLTDYHGALRLHEVGINYRGSTHDAIAYRHTLLVSRLEAPVTYPPDSEISGVHAGSQHAAVLNEAPDMPPEINIPVDEMLHEDTLLRGVRRQLIFDYDGTGTDRRMVQLSLRPGTDIRFEAGALTEFWVRGGLLAVCGTQAHADCFVVCEPGADVRLRSPYGALLIAWAEDRERSDGNLFGF